MLYTFGRGITERYLLPYNRKIWKLDPTLIGTEWVDRIPRPPIEDVVQIGARHRNRGVHPPASFLLSKKRMESSRSRVRSSEKRRSGRAWFSTTKSTPYAEPIEAWIVNGEREYKELVSTIPLRHLSTHCPTSESGP